MEVLGVLHNLHAQNGFILNLLILKFNLLSEGGKVYSMKLKLCRLLYWSVRVIGIISVIYDGTLQLVEVTEKET